MNFLFTLLFCLFPFIVFGKTTTELEVMTQVDRLYRSQKSYSSVQMQIKNPHFERTLKLKVWSEEMQNTLVEVIFPAKEKGIKTLRKGTQVWNYLPKVDQIVPIPPSMMMSNWMGSDLTNDDLVKQTTLAEHYQGHFVTCSQPNPEHLCLQLKPKNKTVSVWAQIILVVNKEDSFPVRQEFYNESGQQIRIFEYSDRKEIQGRSIPTTLKVVLLNEPNRYTTLHYDEIDFSIHLQPDFFSEAGLRKK